jgi:Carboxypeptidase regulatory-like domain
MQKTARITRALLVCVLITAATGAVAQQVNVAQAAGQVTDNSGAVIAGATVRMIETQRGIVHSTETDSSGHYILPSLPVGPYRLEAQKESFKTYAQGGIELQVSDHVTLNVVLQAGAVSQVVEVNAGTNAIQTENASVSNVIESKPISELPLNGRYATQLVLTSGASMAAPGGDETGSKSFYSSVVISVAGGQANATNYLLDGGDNNDTFSNVNLPFPFPDALQEFSVETSSLPARNGLHPGGVVNLVTKSGTNRLHGDHAHLHRPEQKPTTFCAISSAAQSAAKLLPTNYSSSPVIRALVNTPRARRARILLHRQLWLVTSPPWLRLDVNRRERQRLLVRRSSATR